MLLYTLHLHNTPSISPATTVIGAADAPAKLAWSPCWVGNASLRLSVTQNVSQVSKCSMHSLCFHSQPGSEEIGTSCVSDASGCPQDFGTSLSKQLGHVRRHRASVCVACSLLHCWTALFSSVHLMPCAASSQQSFVDYR